MSRYQYDGSIGWRRIGKALGDIKAALAAEHDVHEDDIRAQFLSLRKRICAGRCHADHRHALPLKEGGGRVKKGRVVIDDKAAEFHSNKLSYAVGRARCS